MLSPLVSVIIPTYRRPDLVVNAINSVLRQTYAPVETIVVDDGSGDETPRVLKRYPDVRSIVQENRGPAAARNRGLREATGSFVASLDHDDLWDPHFLEVAVHTMQSLDADMAWLNYRQVGNERSTYENFLHARKSYQHLAGVTGPRLLTNAEARLMLLCNTPQSNSAIVYRRETLGSGWLPEATLCDDWLLIASLLDRASPRVAFIPAVSWTKTSDGANASKPDRRNLTRTIRDVVLLLDHHTQRASDAERQHIRTFLVSLYDDLLYIQGSAGLLRKNFHLWRKSLRFRESLPGKIASMRSLVRCAAYALRQAMRA